MSLQDEVGTKWNRTRRPLTEALARGFVDSFFHSLVLAPSAQVVLGLQDRVDSGVPQAAVTPRVERIVRTLSEEIGHPYLVSLVPEAANLGLASTPVFANSHVELQVHGC